MKMEPKEIIDLLKLFRSSWNDSTNIRASAWKKLRTLFGSGEKPVGFVRDPDRFSLFLEVSRNSLSRKYAPYIVPSIYKGYLLQAMQIQQLYKNGKKAEADKKKTKLNPVANRICNLLTSGMLGIVWQQVDRMIEDGETDDAITGKVSKILDDLINNNAILYVNRFNSKEEILRSAIMEFKRKDYCMAFGSGSQIAVIEDLKDQLREHPETINETIEISYRTEGESKQACLTVFRRIRIKK